VTPDASWWSTCVGDELRRDRFIDMVSAVGLRQPGAAFKAIWLVRLGGGLRLVS